METTVSFTKEQMLQKLELETTDDQPFLIFLRKAAHEGFVELYAAVVFFGERVKIPDMANWTCLDAIKACELPKIREHNENKDPVWDYLVSFILLDGIGGKNINFSHFICKDGDVKPALTNLTLAEALETFF